MIISENIHTFIDESYRHNDKALNLVIVKISPILELYYRYYWGIDLLPGFCYRLHHSRSVSLLYYLSFQSVNS